MSFELLCRLSDNTSSELFIGFTVCCSKRLMMQSLIIDEMLMSNENMTWNKEWRHLSSLLSYSAFMLFITTWPCLAAFLAAFWPSNSLWPLALLRGWLAFKIIHTMRANKKTAASCVSSVPAASVPASVHLIPLIMLIQRIERTCFASVLTSQLLW